MKRIQRLGSALALALIGATHLVAQDIIPAAVTDQNRTGPLPFSSTIQGPVDSVDLGSGGLTVNIPLARVKGRGMDYNLVLRYSSLFWAMNQYTLNNNNYASWGTSAGNWLPGHVVGWEPNQPYVTWLSTKWSCLNGSQGIVPPTGHSAPGTTNTNRGSYVFTDSNGSKHTLFHQWDAGGCYGYNDVGPDSTSEGYWIPALIDIPIILNSDGGRYSKAGTAPDPTTSAPGVSTPFSAGEAGLQDANGNSYTLMPGGVDTLGRTLVSVTQNGSNQLLYSVYDANGNLQTVTINLTTISCSTNFHVQSGFYTYATEASASIPVVTSIVLPNSQTYSFTYETGSYCGMSSMTLPTGATISYTWATISDYDQTHRYVANRTYTVNGVPTTYQIAMQLQGTAHPGVPAGYQTTVSSPDGNQQVYLSVGGKTQSVKEYSGAATGTPMREIDVAYQFPTSFPEDYSTISGWDGALASSITTTLNSSGSSIVSQVQYSYDSYTYPWTWCTAAPQPCSDPSMYETDTITATRGNVTEKREYDWGTPNSGTYGPLLRRTDSTYLHQSNSNYVTANIVDRLASQIVYDGTGNTVAQTQITYDGVTPTPMSGVPQHVTPATNYRGNPTTVSRWRNTDGSWLATTYTYDDTGNITAITDPLNHTTSWNYTDAWSGSGSCVPTATAYAYPTVVTDAMGHQKKVTYQPCTGQQRSVRDPNDLANSRNGTTYTYDLMDRPLTISYADGGSTTNSYTDSIPNKITTTVAINSSLGVNKTSVLEKDYLGRDRKTTLTTDPDGATYTRIAYDSMGRKYQEWNPTRCDPDTYSSCAGETTFGYIEHLYDPLSRETSTIKQDGSTVTTAYNVNTTTVTDEAAVSRASTVDGLGRLTQVNEVNMGWLTAYTYDALGNLTCVEQHGGVTGTGCSASVSNDASSLWRVRRFTYDSLSHLLAAKNPEAGTSSASCNGSTNPWSICYTYNNDGVLTNKTDARGIAVNYSPSASPIDALHRVTEKTYSNSDPTVTYTYDGGAASANGILHRTAMSDASGSTTWTYDSEGRNLVEGRTISGYNKTISTQYNLDGSVWKLTYPSSAVMDFTPGGAGRPTAVHDDTNSIQYVKSATYAPEGDLQGAIAGYTSSFVGITISDKYNTRLQPGLLSASVPAGTLISLSYDFHLGSGDNGNVYTITNNKDNTRNQTFTYDQANRILTAKGGTAWGINFWNTVTNAPGIDPWGNLVQTSGLSGTSILAMSVNQGAASLSNRFTTNGYGYDSAGNVTADGLNSGCGGSNAYTWNGEEQMTCGAGTTYTYDGDGGRVEKTGGSSTPTMYWGGQAGDALAESNTSGTLTSEYIFFDGRRIARRDLPSGTVYYYFSDMLGSSNVITNALGSIMDESDFYPFGGESQITNSLLNHYKFTGKERDTESGNDYFEARYYSSAMGRFMSPDWSAKEEPVPYAKLDDPQSLNLYSYVYNNPLAKADPDGHCPQCLVWGEELVEEAVESPAGQYVLGGIAAGGSAAGAWLVENGGRPSNSAMAPDLSTNSDGTSIYMHGSQTTQAPAPAPAPASGQSTPANPGPSGPYKRPNNATTQEQRDSVQNKPCATCGATGQKNNADHIEPLVQQHYSGGIDPAKMRDPNAVRPQCQSCSNQQGGFLKGFSTAMKKLFGF